ncbi:hypothetical protein [Streptomyces sp. GZWMJZ-114]|uniref:hypothetical protein n=1 Tax=Streptomyces sp. GZWMJZ-114 TaxID=2494734 RepID=UPI001012E4A9|nr:hypothetical protein [Streptomyces sp. GZWMJZ-114]
MLERVAPDEIVIVSGDRDVLAAFTAWNKSAPEMRRLEDLRPTLFDFTVDDGHARSAIIRYLRDQLPAQLDSDPIGIGRIEGLERVYARTRDGDGTSMSSYGASVTHLLALAGVNDVMIEVDEPSASAAARRGNPRVDPGTARHETVYATVEFLASGRPPCSHYGMAVTPRWRSSRSPTCWCARTSASSSPTESSPSWMPPPRPTP